MVRQCYVCKVYDLQEKAKGLSFHRFPANPGKRNIWISLLGFEEGHQFPKFPEICSNHFQQSDFILRDDGSKSLNRNAVPLPRHSLFSSESTVSSKISHKRQQKDISPSIQAKSDDDTITISSSSLEGSPVKKRVTFENEIIFSTCGPSHTISPPRSLVTDKVCTPRMESLVITQSSSSTLMASETEEQLLNKEVVSRSQYQKEIEIRQRTRKIHHVGDLSSENFFSPTKAKKNFRFLKNAIIKQRKKIRTLQATVLSLDKTRTKTLDYLTKLLKTKAYITDSSETILKASLSGSAIEIFERMLKGPSTQKYRRLLIY